MASQGELSPLFRLSTRLDLTGRSATKGIGVAFKKIDPVSLSATVAENVAGGEGGVEIDPETGLPVEEEDSQFWGVLLQSTIDWFMDAHLNALDAVTEYLDSLVTSPVTVDPAAFLGRAGTQTVQQFVGATPTVIIRRTMSGMPAEDALAQSEQLLSSLAQSDTDAIGRDAVATVANNDPRFAKYARVASPGACSWCVMLAGRGAVYTATTANVTRDGQKYHAPYLNKNGKLVGGFCKCTMEAVPAPAHANLAKTRPGRPGDRAAIRAAYKPGAETPERAASLARKVDILRRQHMAGLGNDWTTAKLVELEAEQAGLLGVAFGFGGFKLGRSVFPDGNVRSADQPREPAGSSKGGQFASKAGGAVKAAAGGGTATLEKVGAPEGWTEVGLGLDDPKYVTFQMVTDTLPRTPSSPPRPIKVTVRSDIWDYHSATGEAPGDLANVPKMRAAVAQVAEKIGPVAKANPLFNDLTVTVSPLPGSTGGMTITSTSQGTATSRVTINAELFDESSGLLASFRESANQNYHDRSTGIDPLRAIVTHEYGHAFANDQARGAASEANMQSVFKKRSMFDSMTTYGKSDPGEGYAEAFQSWSMRDLAPPIPAAKPMAELEGWA